jgi:hypothetical protein
MNRHSGLGPRKNILRRKHRRLSAEVLDIAESELDVEMKAQWIAAHTPWEPSSGPALNVGYKDSIEDRHSMMPG